MPEAEADQLDGRPAKDHERYEQRCPTAHATVRLARSGRCSVMIVGLGVGWLCEGRHVAAPFLLRNALDLAWDDRSTRERGIWSQTSFGTLPA